MELAEDILQYFSGELAKRVRSAPRGKWSEIFNKKKDEVAF